MDYRVVFVIILIIVSAASSGCYTRAVSSGDMPPAPAPALDLTPPTGGNIAKNSPLLPTDTPENFIRDYAWAYKGTVWNVHLAIPKDYYQLYRDRPHDRLENYAAYALSDYDRGYLKGLIRNFQDAGEGKNYTETDDVLNVLAFVQSLPYATDKATTGYDEYPRYPTETLVDGGGDCEDTAILAAALLNEMGYGTALIRLPGHMALGVKGSDDYPGSYYTYNGGRYYYLDTTSRDLGIGQLPDAYRGVNATVLPMVRQPRMYENFSFKVDSRDASYAYLRVHSNVSNVGTGTAKNATAYFAALAPEQGENTAWPPDAYAHLGDVPEGVSGWAEATLRVPRDQATQIECVLYGDNFEPVEARSEVFYI